MPTSGKAYVNGFDVTKDVYQIRKSINMVCGGETSGYGLLTVKENLWMFSQLHGISTQVAHERIEHLLKTFGLWDKCNMKVHKLSSGMRQKMNLCRGFVTDPTILFLDEPTLGLDVNVARVIRDYIKKWVKNREGKTVLLTTHYMAEADELCDRVAVIDNGKILVCDTPERLKSMVRKEELFQLEVVPIPLERNIATLRRIPGVKRLAFAQRIETNAADLKFIIEEEATVAEIISCITNQGGKIISLKKTEPTLEDVFVSLVGRGLTEE